MLDQTPNQPDDTQSLAFESFCRSYMQLMIPEWVSPTRCARILGIDKKDIDAAVQSGIIPFSKAGHSYKLNWKLARAHFMRRDIENMKRVQRAIAATPIKRDKVTGNINDRKPRTANVRRIEVNVR